MKRTTVTKDESTMALSHTQTPKVYIVGLKAYNQNKETGAWYELDDFDDKDELWEAVEEANPDEEEFAVHDHENCAEIASENGTDWALLFEMIEAMRCGDEDTAIACAMFAHQGGICSSDSDRVNAAMGNYAHQGSAQEVGVMAAEHLELSGTVEIYFDYEYYGRDIILELSTFMVNGTDYHFSG